MTDANAATLLKQLVKDPLFYVIGIFVTGGVYLMHDNEVGPTWYVGLGCLIFGAIVLIIHMIVAYVDASFQRRYTQIIDLQAKTITSQGKIIKDLNSQSLAVQSSFNDSLTNSLNSNHTQNNDSTPTS